MKKTKKRGRKIGSKKKITDELILKDLPIEKQKLIKTIWKLQPDFKSLEICLSKYSVEQLRKHIILWKKKRKNNEK